MSYDNSTPETIADICREMHEQAQTWWGRKVPNFCDLHDTWAITADRILAAAKRTIYTDNTETLRNALTRIDELTKERDRLRAALLTICTSDKTAEGLREIAIDACNGKGSEVNDEVH